MPFVHIRNLDSTFFAAPLRFFACFDASPSLMVIIIIASSRERPTTGTMSFRPMMRRARTWARFTLWSRVALRWGPRMASAIPGPSLALDTRSVTRERATGSAGGTGWAQAFWIRAGTRIRVWRGARAWIRIRVGVGIRARAASRRVGGRWSFHFGSVSNHQHDYFQFRVRNVLSLGNMSLHTFFGWTAETFCWTRWFSVDALSPFALGSSQPCPSWWGTPRELLQTGCLSWPSGWLAAGFASVCSCKEHSWTGTNQEENETIAWAR